MDMMFWVGLVAGAVTSLVASIAANIWHDRIIEFLETRKLASTSKRKHNELRDFRRARLLHSGKNSQIAFFVFTAGGMVSCTVIVMTSMVASVLIIFIVPDLFRYFDP
jgi:hypothetical protein